MKKMHESQDTVWREKTHCIYHGDDIHWELEKTRTRINVHYWTFYKPVNTATHVSNK